MKHIVPFLWLAVGAAACVTETDPTGPTGPTEPPPPTEVPPGEWPMPRPGEPSPGPHPTPGRLAADTEGWGFPAQRADAPPSAPRIARITNTGGEAIGPLRVEARGHVEDFEIDAAACQDDVIAPGASCEMIMRFHPTGAGPREMSLLVAAAAADAAIRIDLLGSGIGDGLSIPDDGGLGRVLVGTSAARVLTLVNDTDAPLTGLGAPTVSSPFRIARTDCGERVAARGQCQIVVAINATIGGTWNGYLTVRGKERSATARMSAATYGVLEIRVSGADGGHVNVPGFEECPSACTFEITSPTITLEAEALPGRARFQRWSSPCGPQAACTLSIDVPRREITAAFQGP